MPKSLALVLALLLGSSLWVGAAKPKPKPQIDQAQKDAGFRQLFATVFAEWELESRQNPQAGKPALRA